MRLIRRIADELGVRSGPARWMLTVCWSVLGVLAVAHVGFRHWRIPSDTGFGLGREHGYGSMYFALGTLWVVAMCVILAWRLRAPVLAVWATGFAVLFADDWFTLHETYGAQIAREIGVSNSVGELVWLAGLGLLIGPALLVTHLRSRGEARSISTVLFALTAALAFCGIVLDFAHSFVEGRAANTVMLIAEDGGEIVVMCLMATFCTALVFFGHRPQWAWPRDRRAARAALAQEARPEPAPVREHADSASR